MNTTTKPDTKQLAEPKERPATILELLDRPDTRKRLAAVLPKHLTADRMMRVCALAIYKTPLLAECSWPSLLGSIMIFASLGIEPNTPLGHGYLIPFKKNRKKRGPDGQDQWSTTVEVTPIIGYRGYVDLAYRSRLVASLHADVVYRGDDFEYHYGTGMKLIHRPKGEREGRERTHAYAHASLVDGQAFEALPYVEVMAIRNETQAYQQALKDYERSRDQSKTQRERDSALRSYESSPWIAYEHEMASKTMVRRLSKMLPLSIEFANAVAVDTLSDAGALDLTAFTEPGAQAFADMSLAEDPKLIEQGREEPINITNGAQANKSGKPEKESAKQPAGEPPKQQAAAGGNPFDGTQ